MEISIDSVMGRRAGTLMVHLLGRCNLRCSHCYMEGAPSRREQLPLELVLGAVGECERLGIGSLYLTGGEPLLYRGLKEVLHAAADVPGLGVTVCTNAVLLAERHVALLREVGSRVNVSIDGNAPFHDDFRQHAGAFEASERAVRKLADAGLAVTIVTTISQGNLHLLTWIADWALRSGAEQFRVQPLLKLGRGVEIAHQRLTPEQLNRMLLELSDLSNAYRSRGLRCSLVGVSRQFLLMHPCGAYVCNGEGCHRRVAKEIKKLVVREDGTVLPEVTNLDHRFALGGLHDGPLSTLVDRYFDDGYMAFDALCRTTYSEVLPSWQSAVVPWDQIVAERSYSFEYHSQSSNGLPAAACGACAAPA